MKLPKAQDVNFDIDRYLNRFIPPSQLHRLPYPIARFLGYRRSPEQDAGNLLAAFWSFVGTFCGLAVVAAVFNSSPSIQQDHPPALIASFGATAILEYNAIRASLGQPRNSIIGHTLSAIIGVGVTKLFRLRSNFESLRWVAGAVSCGAASSVMLITNTVHPPGGASAVLAAVLPQVTDMGWSFVPLVLLGSVLMLLVGLVSNNIQRQFPVFWWTPDDLRNAREADLERLSDAQRATEPRLEGETVVRDEDILTITGSCVAVPGGLSLNPKEAELLEALRDRLRGMHSPGQQLHHSMISSTDCTMTRSHTTNSQSGLSENGDSFGEKILVMETFGGS
ncbi:hypothetical protein K432DRAFT_444335 [Lepidopterella palustris CBS 459.81]|uniref:HPP transmembrane region domain-containing protein n=1 Tax=Lepidopterella palustris CBS 459.81 TaxID=1314670 RepID=A0A8E2JDS9_9PEZI|nr:hypothetical protein K432DRAFT_444335 [Lepidopterella palustris CBS 459.81]